MTENEKLPLVELICKAALSGGKAILSVYESDFAIEHKDDKSPLTEADKQAHQAIVKELDETEYPVLSEEGRDIPYEERKNWEYFWMVDPLDGTKEFIHRRGEFTVNIGLIEDNIAKLGVVYAPEKGFMYFCDENNNAFELKIKPNFSGSISEAKRIRVNSSRISDLTAITSRSHNNQETTDFLKDVNDYGVSRLIYTDINRDGTKSSPNFDETVRIAEISKCPVIISGGVSSIGDIKKTKELNNKNIEGIIVGKAIYDGDIKLDELAKEVNA